MAESLGIDHFFGLSRAESIAGFVTPLAVFAALFLLHLVLPGRLARGYVTDPATGSTRIYRLNGLLVFVTALAVWALELAGMPRSWLYRSSLHAVVGGTAISAIVAVILVFRRRLGAARNPLWALWYGRDLEVSFFKGRCDLKMFLYVFGGTMMALNAWSGAAYHYELFGENANPGVFLYAALVTFFILDYFTFEHVHLYTYDLIYEHLGFKLIWGCIVIYGWLYVIPLWGMAVRPDPGLASPWTLVWLVGTPVLFLIGWGISRGANLQKYTFKRWPDRTFLGFIEPKSVRAGERRILCSGFWGAARHFNYLGEWLIALGMALAFGHFANPWAWTYFVFIVMLLVFRQRFDDRHCAAKYGADKWVEYKARVKYRIVPGIY